MIRVDAHHHVWRIERGDYGWLTPDLPIHRDYTLDDLRPSLGDIAATVLVQAAATEAETAYMLEVARASEGLVRGVVGWVDVAAPAASARIIDLARDNLLKGLRPMLQDIADTDWILRAECPPAIEALIATGLRFDAHPATPSSGLASALRAASILARGDRPWRQDRNRAGRVAALGG